MELLLVAATAPEIAPTLTFLEQHFERSVDGQSFGHKDLRVFPLCTGVGAVATSWHLARFLSARPVDWAINAGICGAFDPSLQLGEVVHVVAEQFGDLGAEDAEGHFHDLFELGLVPHHEQPFIHNTLYNPGADQARFLPAVHGLTVNRVHGNAGNIEAARRKFANAQVESMEGAAFFYGCLLAGVPFVEIRSVSNYVEPRNRASWQIALAIENLNRVLVEMLKSLGMESR